MFQQIRGFGEYGFPESHAASFALLSYAAAYLKCHYPAEFTCALLNAQPLGFYAPATIVGDAQRQGVPVFPVEVCQSGWECTLETLPAGDCAVRMGLRYVKGLSREDGERIETAVRLAPVSALRDFVRRTSLNIRALTALAEAGAFEWFGLDRRTALWKVRGLARGELEGLALPRRERTPAFAPLDLGEQIAWDYQRTAHSTRGHPVQALQEHLRAQGVPDARTVHALPDGHLVRYAGLVISRQRPSTAKGVVFMTLEDETGFVNVVLWPTMFKRHLVLANTAVFLGVTGRVQVQEGVVHVIAEHLWIPRVGSRPVHVRSRDFH